MIHPRRDLRDRGLPAPGRQLRHRHDPDRAYYDGNSQGGIIGGALAALAPDYDRAVVGVPGMNYSTLLQRSSDFGPDRRSHFALALYNAYPNELERPLVLSSSSCSGTAARPTATPST